MIDKKTLLADCTFPERYKYDGDTLYSLRLGGKEKITVLDRRTGFTENSRDIETGYTNIEGIFWLASGDFDIRRYPELTIVEAINLIKQNANTCIKC
jgi:hypothetical protein